jgi:Choline/ethanolamine kinase
VDALYDDDIIRLVESAPYLPESDERLVQVSDDTVVKLGCEFSSSRSEALAIDLVRASTSIAVPRVRRVIEHEGDGLIVMDLVQGARRLDLCWSSLSCWAKFKVVLTMRYYMQHLRHIRSTTAPPGPLGPQPAECYGLQFGYRPEGPFQNTKALADHFQKELGLAAYRGYTPPQPLDESVFADLVFTHNDLNMRNILLDRDEQVWIVDWGWAGFYPTWFEYVGMRSAAQKDNCPDDWQTAIQFMVEPSFDMEMWMASIGYTFSDEILNKLWADKYQPRKAWFWSRWLSSWRISLWR